MPLKCQCGIYITVPHEHAQGLPKILTPMMTLEQVIGVTRTPEEAAMKLERMILDGLVAKVGEGVFKWTERGARLAASRQEEG